MLDLKLLCYFKDLPACSQWCHHPQLRHFTDKQSKGGSHYIQPKLTLVSYQAIFDSSKKAGYDPSMGGSILLAALIIITRNLWRVLPFILSCKYWLLSAFRQALQKTHSTCRCWERWPGNVLPTFPTFFPRTDTCRVLTRSVQCLVSPAQGALIKGGVWGLGRTVSLGLNRA